MQQGETMPTFVDLNILPEELRPWRYRPLYVLAILALLVASLALGPLYQAQRAASDETARLQAELDLMNHNLVLAQADIGKVRELQRQLGATEAAIASLNEERQEVLGDGQELSLDLSAVLLDLPEGLLSLTSVTETDGEITLTGQVVSQEDAFGYARTLEGSGRFSEARIVSLATESGEPWDSPVTFTIEVVR